MSGGRLVRPYPWTALERLSRRSCAQGNAIRRAAARSVDLTALAPALGSILAAEVTLIPDTVRALDCVASREPCVARARDEPSGLSAWLFADPELVATAVARLLARPVTLGVRGTPISAPIQGAFSALLAETLRRAHAGAVLTVLDDLGAPQGPGLECRGTVIFDSRAFSVACYLQLATPPATAETPSALRRLAKLGSLPLAVPVVVACSQATAEELAALAPGDAWLPGNWSITRDLSGPVVLAAANAEAGVPATLAPGGQLVLGGTDPVFFAEEEPMPDNDDLLASAALSAPLTVRVELGSVTLTADEWSALGPGDVIEVGRRVADPVILRVAGREVARGELVDVEGELGVRIRALGGSS